MCFFFLDKAAGQGRKVRNGKKKSRHSLLLLKKAKRKAGIDVVFCVCECMCMYVYVWGPAELYINMCLEEGVAVLSHNIPVIRPY